MNNIEIQKCMCILGVVLTDLIARTPDDVILVEMNDDLKLMYKALDEEEDGPETVPDAANDKT